MLGLLYSLPGCPACEAVAKLLKESPKMRREVVLGYSFDVHDQETADSLLVKYPQMTCSTCLFGVRLPFLTVDGELIGSHDDIVRWLAS